MSRFCHRMSLSLAKSQRTDVCDRSAYRELMGSAVKILISPQECFDGFMLLRVNSSIHKSLNALINNIPGEVPLYRIPSLAYYGAAFKWQYFKWYVVWWPASPYLIRANWSHLIIALNYKSTSMADDSVPGYSYLRSREDRFQYEIPIMLVVRVNSQFEGRPPQA